MIQLRHKDVRDKATPFNLVQKGVNHWMENCGVAQKEMDEVHGFLGAGGEFLGCSLHRGGRGDGVDLGTQASEILKEPLVSQTLEHKGRELVLPGVAQVEEGEAEFRIWAKEDVAVWN